MRLFIFICFFTGIFLSSAASFAQGKEHNFERDGYDRRFVVYTPPLYTGKQKMPVVMVLHGGGGNLEGTMDQVGMNETADKYGFIVVYPEGIGKGKFHVWNGGKCCGKAHEDDVDDVGYFDQLIEILKKNYAIDHKRIYSTGISNGAQMSYRLSCELSHKVAAIAPIAAQNMIENCKPKRGVPTIHFHGTEDKCAIYKGGYACGGCFADFFRSFGIPIKKHTWPCRSVMQTMEERAKYYSCQSRVPEIYFEHGDVTCKRWTGCRDEAEVELCSVHGGGHTWPGATKNIPACEKRPKGLMCKRWTEGIGKTTQNINANEAMWAFFSRFSL